MRATVVYPPDDPGGHHKFMPVEVDSASHEVACDELFSRFNHAHPGVTGQDAERYGCRSMSVGDMVWFDDGKRFVCCGCGWAEIDSAKSDEILRMEDFGKRNLAYVVP